MGLVIHIEEAADVVSFDIEIGSGSDLGGSDWSD